MAQGMTVRTPPDAGGFSAGEKRWFLNGREVAALRELVEMGYPYAVVLYTLELRLVMDFATGLAGYPRRISERGLLELLHRSPQPGSHYSEKRRGRSWLQRQISALEKVGLVERAPKKRMVFRLLLADSGALRVGEERTYERTTFPRVAGAGADKLGVNSAPKIARISNGYCGEPGAERARSEQHLAAVSGEERTEERTTSVKIFTTTTDPVFEGLSAEQYLAIDAGMMGMVAEAFHGALPGLPRVRFADTPGYRALVGRIWFANPEGKHQTADFWRWYFGQCAASDFLMGRVVANERRGRFRASYRYLLEWETFLKVMNGEYS